MELVWPKSRHLEYAFAVGREYLNVNYRAAAEILEHAVEGSKGKRNLPLDLCARKPVRALAHFLFLAP